MRIWNGNHGGCVHLKPSKTLRFALLLTTTAATILTGVAFAFSVGGTHSFRLPLHGVVSRTPAGRTLRPIASHAAVFNGKSLRPISGSVTKSLQIGGVGAAHEVAHGVVHGTALQQTSADNSNATSPTVTINENVRTFDMYAPAPNFTALMSLISSNVDPVYTPDGEYILYSSNLSSDGFNHIWSQFAAGGSLPVQITSGTSNEYYPAIGVNGTQLAFTSDALSPNNQNLFTMPFSETSATPTDVSTLQSLTVRTDVTIPFSDVTSPTWSSGGNAIAFAAVTSGGTNSHIYFLYTGTNGYLPPGQGSASPPAALTSGPTNDTHPAWSPDGAYIAFSSNASSMQNSTSVVVTPSNAPTTTSNVGATGLNSIWLIGGGTVSALGANPFHATNGSEDDLDPSWAPFGSNSHFQGDIAFSRGTSTSDPHQIYYLKVLSNVSTDTEEGEGFQNAAIQLNTDNTNNLYNDVNPTWQPQQTNPESQVARIAYSSNRSITYNNPTTGAPSETAISLPQGTSGVGGAYIGILESELGTINPPTLLPYSSTEIVHINNGTTSNLAAGSGIRLASAQTPVTFTVRLSDREAGNDDTRIFVQLKDPDSAYQNPAGLEHKVFTHDSLYYTNHAIPGTSNPIQYTDGTDGSSAQLFNGGTQDFTQTVNNVSEDWHGTPAGVENGLPINVGRDGGGTTTVDNPTKGLDYTISAPSFGAENPPASDPNLFISQGQEYECQVVNPSYSGTDVVAADFSNPYYLAGVDDQTPNAFTRGSTQWLQLTKNPTQDSNGGVLYTGHWTNPASTSDFYIDVIAYDPGNNWRIYDNVWGYSTKAFGKNNSILVVNDNALGQKFALTSFTPFSGFANLIPVMYGSESYFTGISTSVLPNAVYYWGEAFGYVNPIPNDNGNYPVSNANPVPGATPTNLTAYSEYDSIALEWTPVANATSNTEYQIFRGTAAGQEGGPIATVTNNVTTYTDTPLLPQTPAVTYYYIVTSINPTGAKSNEASASPSVPVDTGELAPQVQDLDGPITFGGYEVDGDTAPLNTLGTASYPNPFSTPSSTPGPSPGSTTPGYDIWRILSRGPVDSTLSEYLNTQTNPQPAVNDGSITAAATTNAPNQSSCVLWLAPFAGRLFEGPGSIDNPSVQSDVATFVASGGRLLLDGSAIPDALTNDGTSNSSATFLSSTLSSTYVTSTGGSQNLTGSDVAGSRISYDDYFNPTVGDFTQLFSTITAINDSDTVVSTAYGPPASAGLFLGNNYLIDPGFAQIAANVPIWRADGSLDQLGGEYSSYGKNLNQVLARMPTIAAANNAHVDFTYNPPGSVIQNSYKGGSALVYNELASGGRTVFAVAGLEGLGLEFYQVTSTHRTHYFAHNQRPDVMHNIVEYLRTGTLSGSIVGTNGTQAPKGVGGAIVYITPNGGVAIPGNSRNLYSTTTNADGSYFIYGIEAGSYIVHAYAAGFSDATSNPAYGIDADTNPVVTLQLNKLATATITGTVKDENGNGINGAAVTFTSSDGTAIVTGTTGAGGVYTISNVPATSAPGIQYSGSATVAGSAPVASVPDPVAVISGATATANFTLSVPNGTLGGYVTDATNGGVALTGVSITITPTGTGSPTPLTTNGTSSPPQPLGDGKPQNYAGSVAAGSYTVTASKTGYATQTASATVSSNAFTRSDFALSVFVGQTGTLNGLVTNSSAVAISGATVTVTTGTANTVVATVKTGAVTAGTQPFNFTVPNLPVGSYNVTVSAPLYVTSSPAAVTITANTTTYLPVTLASQPPIYTIAAGNIVYFSSPYDYSQQSLSTILGPLNTEPSGTAPNGAQILLYDQAPVFNYVMPTDIALGIGYWIKADQTINIASGLGPRPTGITVSVELQPGWNSIGVPNLSPINVSGISVQPGNAGTILTFDQAASPGESVVYGVLYGYNGSSTYTPITSATAQAGGATTLQPWQGYWIYAYQGCTILLPTGN